MYTYHTSAPTAGQKQKRRVTIVGRIEGGVLQMAISKCRKGDQFVRKTGRKIAIARLEKGKLAKSLNLPDDGFIDQREFNRQAAILEKELRRIPTETEVPVTE